MQRNVNVSPLHGHYDFIRVGNEQIRITTYRHYNYITRIEVLGAVEQSVPRLIYPGVEGLIETYRLIDSQDKLKLTERVRAEFGREVKIEFPKH